MGILSYAKVLGAVILTAIVVTGCAEPAHEQKLDILQPFPCAPPCWQNITPGKTKLDEAIESLRLIPWVDPGSIRIHEFDRVYGKAISFGGSIVGHISITTEGFVEYVYLPIDRNARTAIDTTIHIDELTRLYGPPLADLRAEPIGRSRTSYTLLLAYPQLGWFIVTGFEGPFDSDPPIPPDVSLVSARYMPPESFFEIVQRSPDCLVAWVGYREASYYCKNSCISPATIPVVCPPAPRGLLP